MSYNDDNNQADPKKLFLGNLPWSLKEDQVRELATEFGEVAECHLPLDQAGRSRGIAFVIFENEADAKKAIEGLDGKEVDGRNIHASVARPRRSRN
jgi:RNA recognition motif-containing protein